MRVTLSVRALFCTCLSYFLSVYGLLNNSVCGWVEGEGDSEYWIAKDVKGSVRHLTYPVIPAFVLKELRKTMRNLSQDSQSLWWVLNLGRFEQEAGMLSTRPQRPVQHQVLLSLGLAMHNSSHHLEAQFKSSMFRNPGILKKCTASLVEVYVTSNENMTY